MKSYGWTHRRKNKSGSPYLKLHVQAVVRSDKGGMFIDEDQKFRFVPWENVVEL